MWDRDSGIISSPSWELMEKHQGHRVLLHEAIRAE